MLDVLLEAWNRLHYLMYFPLIWAACLMIHHGAKNPVARVRRTGLLLFMALATVLAIGLWGAGIERGKNVSTLQAEVECP